MGENAHHDPYDFTQNMAHNASHGRCKTMVALEGEWYNKLVMHQKIMGRPLMELKQSALP